MEQMSVHPELWCLHFRVQYEIEENCASRFSNVLYIIGDHYNDKAMRAIFYTLLHISEK